MSRIQTAFQINGQPRKAFIGFLTAGDPSLDKTAEYLAVMATAGADLIEIGIPFSDPVAEGPVIQAANERALRGGVNPEKIFLMLEKHRAAIAVPLVFLTYLNPIFNYGYEKFFARMAATQIDGIIVPDLPFEEKSEIAEIAAKNSVDLISLIAPTSQSRIAKIAREAQGFIYAVSSLGVTGTRQKFNADLAAMVAAIRTASPAPIAVGFGVNTPEQAREISRYADGVIVGSAIVKIIAQSGDRAAKPLAEYIRQMKAAMNPEIER